MQRGRDSGFPASPIKTMTTDTSSNGDIAKLALPKFNGAPDCPIRADDFILMVESTSQIFAWSDGKKCNIAMLHLRDAAHSWAMVYLRGLTAEKKIFDNWPRFRKAFLDRFLKTKSNADKKTIIASLVQKPGEATDEFYVRIQQAILDVPELSKTQEPLLLLTGVRPEIRIFLESDKDLATVEDYLNAARSFEAAHATSKAQGLLIAELASTVRNPTPEPSLATLEPTATPTEDLHELCGKFTDVLASLQNVHRRGIGRGATYKPRGNSNIRGRTFQRPGQPRPNGDRSKAQCFRCKRVGHFKRECRVPESMIAQLDMLHPYDADEVIEPEDGETTGAAYEMLSTLN